MSSAFKRDDWTYTHEHIHTCVTPDCAQCIVSGGGGSVACSAYLNWPSQRVFHLLQATFCNAARGRDAEGERVSERGRGWRIRLFFVCVLPSGSGSGYGYTATAVRLRLRVHLARLNVCAFEMWYECRICLRCASLCSDCHVTYPPPPLPLPTLLPLCGTPRQHVGSWLPPRPLPCRSAC